MTTNSWYFERPILCAQLVARLKDSLFSRMLMLGPRRIGKTSFIIRELMPALVKENCIPVYASLWEHKESPHLGLIQALQKTQDALNKGGVLKEILNTEIKKITALGLGLEFGNARVNAHAAKPDELMLMSALIQQINLAGGRLILIIDEAQHLVTDRAFEPFHYALRTALDKVGESATVLYTGSSRRGIDAMFSQSDMPFFNSATPLEFPLLDADFVEFVQHKLSNEYALQYDVEALKAYFYKTQRSPFWMIRLARELVMNKPDIVDAIAIIDMQIQRESSPEGRLKNVSKLSQLLLYRISQQLPKYSEDAYAWYLSHKVLATKSKVQSAYKSLLNQQLVSLVGKSEFIEEPGVIFYIEEKFGKTK